MVRQSKKSGKVLNGTAPAVETLTPPAGKNGNYIAAEYLKKELTATADEAERKVIEDAIDTLEASKTPPALEPEALTQTEQELIRALRRGNVSEILDRLITDHDAREPQPEAPPATPKWQPDDIGEGETGGDYLHRKNLERARQRFETVWPGMALALHITAELACARLLPSDLLEIEDDGKALWWFIDKIDSAITEGLGKIDTNELLRYI